MYIEMRSIFALFSHCEGVRRASPGQCARTRSRSPGAPGALGVLGAALQELWGRRGVLRATLPELWGIRGARSCSPGVPGASGGLGAALPEFRGHLGDSEPLSQSSKGIGGTRSRSPGVPGVSGGLRAALPEFQGHQGDSEPLSGSSGGGHGAPPKPLSEACSLSEACGETARVCLHTSSCAPCCEHCVRLVTNKGVESWPVVLQLRRVRASRDATGARTCPIGPAGQV